MPRFRTFDRSTALLQSADVALYAALSLKLRADKICLPEETVSIQKAGRRSLDELKAHVMARGDKVLGKWAVHVLVCLVLDGGIVGREQKGDEAVEEHCVGRGICILEEAPPQGRSVESALQGHAQVSSESGGIRVEEYMTYVLF